MAEQVIQVGRTGLRCNQDGFGALPIQRAGREEAVHIFRRALDRGITYFDTARAYTDSEEKLGAAFSTMRNGVILATKTAAGTVEGFWQDLAISLKNLRTDHIDIYQFHNPPACPKPDDGTGLYEAMLRAKEQGKIRFIGLTNHRLPVAIEAVHSGLYDTLQFPLSYLSTEAETDLVRLCEEKRVGFVAMKALSGGLITDIAAARSWIMAFPNAVPIWGIQRESELDTLFAAMEGSAKLSEAQLRRIEADRAELSGAFCRGCGYCLPCPAEIPIPMCARMSLLLRRMPAQQFLTPHWQGEMAKIADCQHCDHCASHCPYGLDTPGLLAKNYEDYQKFLAGSKGP